MGYFAETYDIENQTNTSFAIVTGKLHLTKIGLAQGDYVASIITRATTAITAGTLYKRGIFRVVTNGTDHRAVCLGQTDDRRADYATSGCKRLPIAAPFTITEDDQYYVGDLFVGTTGPALYARLNASLNANLPVDGLTGSAKAFAYHIDSQADMPAVGASTGALACDTFNLQLWAGVSAS